MKLNFLRKFSVTVSALPIVITELDPKLIITSGRYGISKRSSISNHRGSMTVASEVGRGTTFTVHGHIWQRDPYLAGAVPSQTIGDNPIGMWLGGQESVTPAQHFEIRLEEAGGETLNSDVSVKILRHQIPIA